MDSMEALHTLHPTPCKGCKHLWWVDADPMGTSRDGWGCLASGGHAVSRCGHFELVSDENQLELPL